ncbi:MAG: sialidase family protein [Actinomycetota bacterium]
MRRLLGRHRVLAVGIGTLLSVTTLLATPSIAAANHGIGLEEGSQSPATPTDMRVISGASDLPADCNAAADATGRKGEEREPVVAVNPRDHKNVVAVWEADWQDGLVVATSFDEGNTWTKVVPPGLMPGCNDKVMYNGAINPVLAFSEDGTLYLSSFLGNNSLTGAIAVNVSTDGGLTWSDRKSVISVTSPQHVDATYLATDPSSPGTAYVAWNYSVGLQLDRTMEFSRTTDGGQTWSAPQPIGPAQLTDTQFMCTLNVLRDGKLLATFERGAVTDDNLTLYSTTSSDGGNSWSDPLSMASIPSSFADDDSYRGATDPVHPVPSTVTASNGTISTIWALVISHKSSQVWMTSSRDDGGSWSTPAVAFEDSSEVLDLTAGIGNNGDPGVIYYDFRNDQTSGDDVLLTDLWFNKPCGSPGTWCETHLAGPFDADKMPNDAIEETFGDYEGVAAVPSGFVVVGTVVTGSPVTGPSDILFGFIQQ